MFTSAPVGTVSSCVCGYRSNNNYMVITNTWGVNRANSVDIFGGRLVPHNGRKSATYAN